MAVALKARYFKNATELAAFCVLVGNNVTTVISIQWDPTTGQFALFYT